MSKYKELVDLLEEVGVLQLEDDWAIRIQQLVKKNGADSYSAGCCCPPKGHQGLWGAGMCPVHQGLRRVAKE